MSREISQAGAGVRICCQHMFSHMWEHTALVPHTCVAFVSAQRTCTSSMQPRPMHNTALWLCCRVHQPAHLHLAGQRRVHRQDDELGHCRSQALHALKQDLQKKKIEVRQSSSGSACQYRRGNALPNRRPGLFTRSNRICVRVPHAAVRGSQIRAHPNQQPAYAQPQPQLRLR